MINRGNKQNSFSMRSYFLGSSAFQKRAIGKRRKVEASPETADARLLQRLLDAGASEAVIERLVPNIKASDDQLRVARASKRNLILGKEL